MPIPTLSRCWRPPGRQSEPTSRRARPKRVASRQPSGHTDRAERTAPPDERTGEEEQWLGRLLALASRAAGEGQDEVVWNVLGPPLFSEGARRELLLLRDLRSARHLRAAAHPSQAGRVHLHAGGHVRSAARRGEGAGAAGRSRAHADGRAARLLQQHDAPTRALFWVSARRPAEGAVRPAPRPTDIDEAMRSRRCTTSTSYAESKPWPRPDNTAFVEPGTSASPRRQSVLGCAGCTKTRGAIPV